MPRSPRSRSPSAEDAQAAIPPASDHLQVGEQVETDEPGGVDDNVPGLETEEQDEAPEQSEPLTPDNFRDRLLEAILEETSKVTSVRRVLTRFSKHHGKCFLLLDGNEVALVRTGMSAARQIADLETDVETMFQVVERLDRKMRAK